MNPDDYALVLSLCDEATETAPALEERRRIVAKIDVDAIHRDLINGILSKLGSSAKDWYYAFQSNAHVEVFNPHLPKDEQTQICHVEWEVKDQLRLFFGDAVLEPWGKGFDINEYNKCKPGEGLKKQWHPLPELVNEVEKICDCWYPFAMNIAFLRSGKYLVPGAEKEENLDLGIRRNS